MTAVIVGDDKIDRIGIVELVDFIRVVDDGNVPTEKVDEQSFAVSEHGLQQRPMLGRAMIVDYMNHGMLQLR